MGTRDAAKPAAWRGENSKAHVGSFSDAQPLGKLWVLAVKGHGGSRSVACPHEPEPGRKLVMDSCNPIADLPPDDGVPHFFTAFLDPDGVQKQFPSTRSMPAFKPYGCGGNGLQPARAIEPLSMIEASQVFG